MALAGDALGEEDFEQGLIGHVAAIREYPQVLDHGKRQAQAATRHHLHMLPAGIAAIPVEIGPPAGRTGPSRYLPVSAGSLMAACVMHRLAVELCTVRCWTLAAPGHGPTVALAKIEMMIDVSIETVRSVKPRARADE